MTAQRYGYQFGDAVGEPPSVTHPVADGGSRSVAGTHARNAPGMWCSVCGTEIGPDDHVTRVHYPVPSQFGGVNFDSRSRSVGSVCVDCYDHGDPIMRHGHGPRSRTYLHGGECAWCGRRCSVVWQRQRRWQSCSDHCAYELKKQAQRERREATRGVVHSYTCGICGDEFTSSRSSWLRSRRPTYCSNACRQKAYRQRKARWKK